LKPQIIKADSLGFCMGVRRAIEGINSAACRRGGIETLGALVHNQQVLRQLSERGVKIVEDAADLTGDTVVISAHGVSPLVIDGIAKRGIAVIDTTCPFVKRAQTAARKLAEAGFFTLVFGDVGHPEVKGILGWAGGAGLATTRACDVQALNEVPLKLGILSQTTQIPDAFNIFVKDVLDIALRRDAEVRIIDTLCHDIRRRQADTLTMANQCDLVLVIGGRNSANTRHLYDLCSTVAETHLIETAAEIDPLWLAGRRCIGVTAGASTDDQTIDQVVVRLETLAETAG
jgi:4-hydroxy-3-methylbut-2-enyl diphosphate reductase